MKVWKFNSKYIRFLLRPADWRKFKLHAFSDLNSHLEQFAATLNNKDYKLSKIAPVRSGGKTLYKADKLEDRLALRHISNEIRDHYRLKLPDRHRITKQISILLTSDAPIHCIRTDITNFFGSIDFDALIRQIGSDAAVGSRELSVLRTLRDHGPEKGLPWGIATSSSLAEVCLQEVDQICRSIPGIYYYSRFVDDIIIFCSTDAKRTFRKVEKALTRNGLKFRLNSQKTKILERIDSKTQNIKGFDYLGYHFVIHGNGNVEVRIADNKLEKIRARMRRIFSTYSKDFSHSRMIDGLKLLTGNYSIRKESHSARIKTGIYYNYPLLDNLSQLDRLDEDLHYLILRTLKMPFCETNPSYRASLRKCFRYSFRSGYEKRIMHHISLERVIVILKGLNEE